MEIRSKDVIISVAMATYNGARFLQQQLDSLYSQKRIPDEIIVCDDCSTDNTVNILEEYNKRYGLEYYVNDTKLGVNGNFFKAISLCHGDYISICDQDDIWLPEKIEKCLETISEIENGSPAVVSCESEDIDADGNLLSNMKRHSNYYGYSRTLLYPKERCQGCSLFLNRELADYVLDKYSQKAFTVDYIIYDAFIAYSGAMIGNKCDIGETLFLYRHHDNNVIGKVQNKLTFREHLKVQGRFRGFLPDLRFLTIERIYNLVKDDVKNDDIHILINKLKRINGSSSLFSSFVTILTIKELDCFEKIKIVMSTIAISILKYLMKA